MKQNTTCQKAKKRQPRKGATEPFFGRGMGAHGVQGGPWCGAGPSGSLRQRRTRPCRNTCGRAPQEQSSGNATTLGALQGKGDLQTLHKDTQAATAVFQAG